MKISFGNRFLVNCITLEKAAELNSTFSKVSLFSRITPLKQDEFTRNESQIMCTLTTDGFNQEQDDFIRKSLEGFEYTEIKDNLSNDDKKRQMLDKI